VAEFWRIPLGVPRNPGEFRYEAMRRSEFWRIPLRGILREQTLNGNSGGPFMNQAVAVLTRGLTKSYGPVPALRGVDLEVRRGEIFGFLGPNGAGKTTTIRCLLDLIRPSGGTVRVLGLDPQAEPLAVRARVGYLPGELRLDDNFTAEGAL